CPPLVKCECDRSIHLPGKALCLAETPGAYDLPPPGRSPGYFRRETNPPIQHSPESPAEPRRPKALARACRHKGIALWGDFRARVPSRPKRRWPECRLPPASTPETQGSPVEL